MSDIWNIPLRHHSNQKMLKPILTISFIFLVSACASTARYKAIKKSRQEQNQSQNNYSSRKRHDSKFNTQLENYIQDWIGVPYKYGGLGKNGIDCSGFTLTVFNDVYNYELPRTALDQYNSGRKISSTYLNEGDLVFFRGVRGTGIDHVGIYLSDDKFVHASTSVGVTISDLSEEYYAKRFVGACRY